VALAFAILGHSSTPSSLSPPHINFILITNPQFSVTMMAFESGTDYPESDADDEYERSGSPVLATDDEGSPSDSEGPSSNEHTPTIYEKAIGSDQLPETIITEWTPEECADFVGSLGLRQYADQFLGTLSVPS
jgi:hypothetical protein